LNPVKPENHHETQPKGNTIMADKNVPHEDQVDKAVDDQLARTSDHAAVADLASPGATYVQAEAVAARNKINEILDVLRDAGLVPAA
jgi:hypothetical protein